MSEKQNASEISEKEAPPILGSWRKMYAFVLILHALVILFFWLFGQYWS